MPWRNLTGTTGALSREAVFYRVWLSEIMLQQTRVEAVIPYYDRFLSRFPTIEALATAEDSDVLTAWSGLGYYSRARNLQAAARQIVEFGLPSTHAQILSLRGVGIYTAAAVASIALDLAHAAVDGNVIRVISRLTNDPSEITATATRRNIAAVTEGLLDPRRPGDFNQAMMELGATVCLPGTPRCERCPVVTFCAAREAGTERELPVKLKKQAVREVALELAIVERGELIFLVKRAASERRLAEFWELPLREMLPNVRANKIGEFQHQIVNDRFRVTVWQIVAIGPKLDIPAGEWIDSRQLPNLPLTTVTRKALDSRSS